MGSRDVEQPTPTEVGAKAMRLLRERGHLALEEVERLFQWERPWAMPNRLLAERLGVTKGQLKRLIWGEHLREKERRQRSARRKAGELPLIGFVSRELQFSISLPASWQVTTNTREIVPLAAECRKVIECSKPAKGPTGHFGVRGLPRLSASGNTSEVIDIRERLRARVQYEARREDAERHARLERMTLGLFQAGPVADEDEPMIEIARLATDTPMSALALYELDKRPPREVPWANRPNRGMTIDGLAGVVYYFAMDTGERPLTAATYKAQPVFFNVYLADDLEGWILSCQCRRGEAYMKTFQAYKPVFRRILGSFKSLQAEGRGRMGGGSRARNSA